MNDPLHDNTLTVDNRDKFMYLVGQYHQQIKFYNVETLAENRLASLQNAMPESVKARFSIGSVYRLLLPTVMDPNIDRVIYLDADTFVNLNINELWSIDINDHTLAVVTERLIHGADNQPSKYLIDVGRVKAEDYFNSGVLLINLDRFRSRLEDLNEAFAFVCDHSECDFFDQDILNYRFAEDSLKLDLDDPFNRLYFECFVKTPMVQCQHPRQYLQNRREFCQETTECFTRHGKASQQRASCVCHRLGRY